MWSCALLLLQAPSAERRENALETLITAHCAECHGAERPKGDLDLEAWVDGSIPFSAESLRESLERVRERLLLGEMPPPSRPRPTENELDGALAWLDANLPQEAIAKPSLRRLNRSEYERSVRDLFGVSYSTREFFPADDVGAMFDNDAAVASVSELGVERWIEAAERVAARALPPLVDCSTRLLGATELKSEGGITRRATELSMYSGGKAFAEIEVPRNGRYRIEVIAWGDMAGDEAPRLAIEVDGRSLGELEIHAEHGAKDTLEVSAAFSAGEHEFSARFVNDFYVEEGLNVKRQDRNAHVASLALIGPLDPAPATRFTEWIDGLLAKQSFEAALGELGLRVWRRPLDSAEVQRLSKLSDPAQASRERAGVALVALLASPNFLYRIESTKNAASLSGFELATRLSYFLWASAPDARLLELAASGELLDEKVRAAEIRRLLRDARSRSLVEEFGAQWLGWRALEHSTPDPHTFPAANEALLSSMRQESEAFFEAMLREDRPLDEFLDADFTFVDERLARLYGIEGVSGAGLRRVHLDDRERGGLLGQAAILTATSNPTRTSPVKRGKWVLETLLGSRVPPPPPGVGALLDPAPGVAPKSLREQLDLHRSKQDCASCHNRLDPLGFALEGFDASGQRRTHDGAADIDARGTFADGSEVNGVRELKQYLKSRGAFPHALARALFLYALGRAPARGEARELQKAVDELPVEKRTLASVIEVVCRQTAFLHAGTSP